jgi:type IV pilus assembly protein PilN
VILINLLPHREVARKRRKDVFNVALAAAALTGGLIAGGIYLWYEAQISDQRNTNQVLQTEIKQLEAQIKDIANLETEIAALRARQQAVEDLQSDRNMPVHLLNELVGQLPDGVFVASMKQDNQAVTLQGTAQSNERISELLRNLANNTPWFTKPELVEIVSASLALSPREQKRVANFTIRVRLVRSSETAKSESVTKVAQPGQTPATTAGEKK